MEVIPQKGDFVQIYFRVRVEANISKPLLCGIYLRIRDGSRKWITFSYERMPLYCYLCDIVSYHEKKCLSKFRDGFVDLGQNFPYCDWLKVLGPGSALKGD